MTIFHGRCKLPLRGHTLWLKKRKSYIPKVDDGHSGWAPYR